MSLWHGWNTRGSGFTTCDCCGDPSEHRLWDNDVVIAELCHHHWKSWKRGVGAFKLDMGWYQDFVIGHGGTLRPEIKKYTDAFIVKVQLSMASSDGKRWIMVYDETRKIQQEFEATDEILKKLKGALKSFWWAQSGKDRYLHLIEKAPWQAW